MESIKRDKSTFNLSLLAEKETPADDDLLIINDSEDGYVNKRVKVKNLPTGEGGGESSSEYMVPIWAEENAALGANNYEWAFGNGANSPADGGITIYVPSGWTCEVVAMTLRIGGGTATVQLVHNGVSKGLGASVVIAAGQSATNELSVPVEIANNDLINFRTLAASGTSSPCVVTAWLKYIKE